MFKVKNNENGKIREFKTIKEAIAFQEYCAFILGIDCEVL